MEAFEYGRCSHNVLNFVTEASIGPISPAVDNLIYGVPCKSVAVSAAKMRNVDPFKTLD